ncbi:MAG: DUF5689 domain-containing protein [Bacteroidia bacterium]
MKVKQFYSLIVILIFAIASCKKEKDKPPVIDMLGHKVYSAQELRAIATCTNSCSKYFTSDVYFIGIVVADETTGNFYKEIYVRDRYNSGAIHLDFNFRSSFFVGDSIRVNLKGLNVSVNEDTDMLEIDSLDYEKHVIKFASGGNPQPRIIHLNQLNASNPYNNYLCDLIQIQNVGFLPADTNQIWADPIAQMSINRYIQDCDGNQVVVRTSNYADFALQKTPKGNGTIIGVATSYQGTNQLAIRRPSEANMSGAPCLVYHKKDFEDLSLTSGGWSQQSVVNPSIQWSASSYGGDNFGKISGYSGGNQNAENWLISPALDLSSSNNPILTFRTAAKFSGDILEVYVSTNYSSGLPSAATWTQLTGFALSPNNPGNYAWTPSGSVSLSGHKSSATRIAFKYKSTTSGSTTYEVDDIVIREN